MSGQPQIQPAVARVRVANPANALTGLRLALVPIFLLALFAGDGQETASRIAAFVIFAAAIVTDRLDGMLARNYGMVTKFGTLADPIADKALIGAALIGLSVLGDLPWWVTALILIREIGITVLRFIVLHRGVIPSSRGGKLKTLVQAVAIGLFVLPLSGPWLATAELVMAVAIVLTVVTGVDYVMSAVADMRDVGLRPGTAAPGTAAPGTAAPGTKTAAAGVELGDVDVTRHRKRAGDVHDDGIAS